jgi:hypothetical protein
MGHAAILEYAVSLSLPLSRSTVLGAIKGRSIKCLKIALRAAPDNVPHFALVIRCGTRLHPGGPLLAQAGFSALGGGFPH